MLDAEELCESFSFFHYCQMLDITSRGTTALDEIFSSIVYPKNRAGKQI